MKESEKNFENENKDSNQDKSHNVEDGETEADKKISTDSLEHESKLNDLNDALCQNKEKIIASFKENA